MLSVLAFSTEYSTGLIRTTFAAVPRRRAVLAARAAVTGAVTLVAGELVAFVSFGPAACHPGRVRAGPIFTVSRRGCDRKPAVRVVLDALAAEAAAPRPAAA